MLRVFRVHAAASDTDARRSKRKGPNDLVVLHLLLAEDFTVRLYFSPELRFEQGVDRWPNPPAARVYRTLVQFREGNVLAVWGPDRVRHGPTIIWRAVQGDPPRLAGCWRPNPQVMAHDGQKQLSVGGVRPFVHVAHSNYLHVI
jgi:hypothetical protein